MKIIAFSCVLALCGAVHAGQTTYGAGSQAAPWLNLPASARTAALGGASVAIAPDINSVPVNPAGLGRFSGQQLSLEHDADVQDASFEHLGYGLGLDGAGGVALGVDYMNYGSVPAYAAVNGVLTPAGTLDPYGLGVDLSYGQAVGAVQLGVTLKMVSEALDGHGAQSAVGGDLGLLWRQQGAGGLSAGLALRNVGGALDGAALPTQTLAGLAYRFAFNGSQALTLAGDAVLPAADAGADALDVGLEYSSGGAWALRGGYKFAGNDEAGGFSVGGGLNYGILGLDYAYVSGGVLGNVNVLSLATHFSAGSAPVAPTAARPDAVTALAAAPAAVVAQPTPVAAPVPPVPAVPSQAERVAAVQAAVAGLKGSARLTFAKGGATLSPEGEAAMAGLIGSLAQAPSVLLRVRGYSDASGGAGVNLRVSAARAQAVRQALLGAGLAPERIAEVKGLGAVDPLADNATEEGRRLNRRVELVLVQPGKE